MNPPTTAPKDQAFLGRFGAGTLRPAIWNPAFKRWSVGMLEVKQHHGEWKNIQFKNELFDPSELLGWLPIVEEPARAHRRIQS